MSEQILEPQVQPKAEEVRNIPLQPTVNYAELTSFLDKYFENKVQTQQKVDQVLNQIDTVNPNNDSLVARPIDSWEQGLDYLKKDLATTIDRIRDLLDYDDYDNTSFDHKLNTEGMRRKRQFWLHAHLLGGQKMADMLVDKIRRGKKDYAIFNAGIYR